MDAHKGTTPSVATVENIAPLRTASQTPAEDESASVKDGQIRRIPQCSLYRHRATTQHQME
jgi:hypothetical protein